MEDPQVLSTVFSTIKLFIVIHKIFFCFYFQQQLLHISFVIFVEKIIVLFFVRQHIAINFIKCDDWIRWLETHNIQASATKNMKKRLVRLESTRSFATRKTSLYLVVRHFRVGIFVWFSRETSAWHRRILFLWNAMLRIEVSRLVASNPSRSNGVDAF